MPRKSAKRKRNPGKAQETRGAGPKPDLWSRVPERIQHGICLAVLVAVSVGFFAPLHFSGKTLAPSDTVNGRAMARVMEDYREATGEPALWAPNGFAGMPGYLISYPTQIPQLDDLPRLFRKYIWPTSHFIFLLVGVYLLVFLLTREKLGGVLAACAFGLTTYIPVILVAGHNTKFMALCFAPWLVLAFAHTLRKPGWLSGMLFAAALALNLRAGHIQITYYFTFLLGLWWLVEGIQAYRRGDLKAFGQATGFLVLGGVLALCMVAQPYLVNYEFKGYTIRGMASGGGASGLDWSYAMSWSQGLGELLTLAVADAFGGSGATYWGPKPFTAGPHYVGGIVIALAVLALWRLRKGSVWAFSLGGGLMILFSLGEHFSALNRLMFDHFPLFSTFRVPETWLSAVAFTMAVLAAQGLYVLGREAAATAAAATAHARHFYIVWGAAVGLLLVLILARDVFFDFERPDEARQLMGMLVQQRPDLSPSDPQVQRFVMEEVGRRREARVEMFKDDALRTLLFLVLSGLAIAAFMAGRVPRWGMQAAVALLVLIDLGGVGRRYFNEGVLQPVSNLDAAIPRYDFDQFILDQREAAGGEGHFRVLSLEGTQTANARPNYFYETLGGYNGAKLRLYQDYLEHLLFDAPEVPNANALALTNTRYVVSRTPLPGLNIVYRSQTGFLVLENEAARPRAFFVGQTEVIPDAGAAWARLRSPAFDVATTAVLPEAIPFETTPLDSTSTASVALLRHTPREIAWTVQTDRPRLLVAAEVYYPAGWHATLDGEGVPIYRADYLLRAVPVPAGTHTLVMRFDPALHTWGVWISGIATLLVYGTIVLLLGMGRARAGDA